MLKPHIFKTEGRWGFTHVPGRVAWVLRNAAAVWCRKRNLIEGNL